MVKQYRIRICIWFHVYTFYCSAEYTLTYGNKDTHICHALRFFQDSPQFIIILFLLLTRIDDEKHIIWLFRSIKQ